MHHIYNIHANVIYTLMVPGLTNLYTSPAVNKWTAHTTTNKCRSQPVALPHMQYVGVVNIVVNGLLVQEVKEVLDGWRDANSAQVGIDT